MPASISFLKVGVLVLTAAVAALLPAPAAAQQEPEFFDDQPYAPGEWNIGRRMDESQFRYCVDPRDPAWKQDGEIADAIAHGLLLQPQRYVVPSEFEVEDLTRIYAILLEQCDVYMGFKLIPSGYPSWVALTRPYGEFGYVFVTARPDVRALADLPPGRPIAATRGTTAHVRLVSYNIALPPAQRWPVFPFGSDQLALESTLSGTADVALVWEPSFRDTQQSNPAYAAFHIIAPTPLPPTTLGVGGLLLRQNTFLRAAVDQAITALTADGTIPAILNKYKSPATGKP